MKPLFLLLLACLSLNAQIKQGETIYWSPVTNAVSEGYSNVTYMVAVTPTNAVIPAGGLIIATDAHEIGSLTGTSIALSTLIPSNYPSGPCTLWVEAEAQWNGYYSNSTWITLSTNYQAPVPPPPPAILPPSLLKVQ